MALAGKTALSELVAELLAAMLGQCPELVKGLLRGSRKTVDMTAVWAEGPAIVLAQQGAVRAARAAGWTCFEAHEKPLARVWHKPAEHFSRHQV